MMPFDIDMESLRRLGALRTAVVALAAGSGNADEARAAYRAVQERAEGGASERLCREVASYASVLEEAIGEAPSDSAVFQEGLLSPLERIESLIVDPESSPAVDPGEATRSTETPAPPRSPDRGLDDVAAFLIQMEPALMNSITDLRDRFRGVVDTWDGSDEVLAQMTEALTELDSVASSKSSRKTRRVDAVEKVGQALEVAMYAEEEEENFFTAVDEQKADEPQASAPVDPRESPATPAAPVAAEQVAAPAGPTRPASLDSDPELVLDFVAEGLEYLDQAEEALLALEQNPSDEESVNVTFRAFHTIKGVAGFLEFDQVQEVAHHAETLLSQVRDKTLPFTAAAADLFLRSADVLRGLLLSIRGVVNGGEEDLPGGLDRLLALLADPSLAGKVARDEPLGLRRRTAEEEEPEAVADKTAPSSKGGESVRIPTERLDRLVDLVGELVVSHSMIGQDDEVLRSKGDLSKNVSHSQKILRELQDLSTALRMVPMKPAFHKVSRVVRDVARKSGKKVRLVTIGGDTELDRSMVATLTDPLVHMIRNSIDHGLESPEERKAAGKPEVGTVRLSARHAGGSVIVEIEDDGKGLDRDQLLAKAIEKGLVGSDRTLSDEEVFNFIFHPGFSTAANVTDISGRGVGMDVVRRAVESLRGRIEIQSTPGRGTRFSIYLPLTLAITDGMLVRVGAERYIIPTVKIQVSLRPQRDDIWTVSGRGEMVMLQGDLVPIARMHKLFDIQGSVTDPTEALLVVVGEGNRRTAFMVDELLGQHQFVVKALTGHVASTPGIAGGAILSDGGVGLILDPENLLDETSSQGSGRGSKTAAA